MGRWAIYEHSYLAALILGCGFALGIFSLAWCSGISSESVGKWFGVTGAVLLLVLGIHQSYAVFQEGIEETISDHFNEYPAAWKELPPKALVPLYLQHRLGSDASTGIYGFLRVRARDGSEKRSRYLRARYMVSERFERKGVWAWWCWSVQAAGLMIAGAVAGSRGAFMNRSRKYVQEQQAILDTKTKPRRSTPDPHPAATGPVPLARIIPVQVEADESKTRDPENVKMIRAMQRGDPDKVRKAAEAGHSLLGPDIQDVLFIFRAAKYNRPEIVRMILAAGEDVNRRDRNGVTPLLAAAGMGATESVRELVKAGADVDAADYHGLTPLAAACVHGSTPSPEAVELLTAAGADPRQKLWDGRSLLCGAAESGFLMIAEKLIDLGLDVNERVSGGSYEGATAIYFPVWRGDKVLFEVLRRRGASLDRAAPKGRTLLHVAAAAGRPEMVQHLLDLGVDPAARDDVNLTAFEHADWQDRPDAGKTRCAELLRETALQAK
jgi:ankyrin repeat protein